MSAEKTIGLTQAQAELLADEKSRFLGFVGGYGAGKSRALGFKGLRLAEANSPYPIIMCEPSFRQVKRVLIPTLRDIVTQIDPWAWKNKRFNKLDMELRLTLNGKECTIYLSNAKDPDGIAGINAAAALVDEAALVPDEVLEQIKARVREERAPVRQLCLFGTPDQGKKGHFYDWLAGDDALPNSRLIRASSRENYFLEENYVDEQLSGYDEQEKLRYIDGHFVDFAGRVYTQYKTDIHELECQTKDEGDLVVAADFGRGCMPFAIGRIVGEQLHVFDEVVFEGYDILDAADKLAERVSGLLSRRAGFSVSPGDLEALSNVTIYADPAGTALYRGSASEVRVLRARGFNVITRRKHPRIMDRVNSVQQRLRLGELFIDPDGAPYIAKCLREQGFGPNGLPEKSMPSVGRKGLDHGADAIGYLCEYVWPAALGQTSQGYYH